MSANSPIEWTDHTFNPWWGCTKVSPGCTHCYADILATRYGHDVWGPKAERRFFGDKHWDEPLKWNRKAEAEGVRRRVFCASMADVFERHMVEEIDIQLAAARWRLFGLIEHTPWLDWLLLTKRPQNIREMIPTHWLSSATTAHNVWYGTSAENQQYADERIPHLLRVPAVVRFLSCEPLLGPISLGHYLVDDWTRIGDDVRYHEHPVLHWIIAGGESGPGARPMHPDWARSLRDQCQEAGVAFHFKQHGEHIALDQAGAAGIQVNMIDAMNANTLGGGFLRVGKKAAGRLLDGRTWDEFPESAVPA